MREATRNRIASAVTSLTEALGEADDENGLKMALGAVSAVSFDFPYLIHEIRWELEEKRRVVAAAAAAAAVTA